MTVLFAALLLCLLWWQAVYWLAKLFTWWIDWIEDG